jgi:hypothetical protein
MTKTITAVFASPTQVTNAFDDLVSTGIPQDKIFADQEKPEIKVASPETSVPEIKEILNRHQPKDISEKPFNPA